MLLLREIPAPHAPGRGRLPPGEARPRPAADAAGGRMLRSRRLSVLSTVPRAARLPPWPAAPHEREEMPNMDALTVAVERGGIGESTPRGHAGSVHHGETIEAHG